MALPNRNPDTFQYYMLRTVITQFQAYLAQPNHQEISSEDQEAMASILQAIADVEGDFNHHLKYHSQLRVVVSWYYNKYKGFMIVNAREADICFNAKFTSLRQNGYGEWDAKRMAENDSSWVHLSRRLDQYKILVNILDSLVESCKERLQALQQIANNYRAEMRDEKSTI